MKLIPFSKDYCKVLINSGYSYFVIKQDAQRGDYANNDLRVTYKATRNASVDNNIVPIMELLDDRVAVREDSYIMVAD